MRVIDASEASSPLKFLENLPPRGAVCIIAVLQLQVSVLAV